MNTSIRRAMLLAIVQLAAHSGASASDAASDKTYPDDWLSPTAAAAAQRPPLRDAANGRRSMHVMLDSGPDRRWS
jgi:hypothetical protein